MPTTSAAPVARAASDQRPSWLAMSSTRAPSKDIPVLAEDRLVAKVQAAPVGRRRARLVEARERVEEHRRAGRPAWSAGWVREPDESAGERIPHAPRTVGERPFH